MRKFKTISQVLEAGPNMFNGQEFEKLMLEASSVNDYRTIQKDSNYRRLLERVLPIEEASTIEYFGLNESDKNRIDDIIWEHVYRYANTETIDEGFFDSFVQQAKQIGGKAVDIGKKIVSSIGSWLKAIKEFAVKGYTAAVEAGKKAGGALVAKMKKAAEDKLAHKLDKSDPKTVTGDLKNLKDTVNYVMNGAVKKVENGMDDAANAMKAAKPEDIEDAEKKLAAAAEGDKNKPGEGNPENKGGKPPVESKLNNYSNIIVELRKHENADALNLMCEYSITELQSLLAEDAADGQQMATDAEKKATDNAKSTVKTVLDKAKAGWRTILHIVVSGITVFVETGIKALLSKSLKTFSGFVKGAGGPGVFEFLAISTLAAGIIGLTLEFAAEIVGEEAMPKWVNAVSHALHATSLGSFAAHGAESMIPGAGACIKFIAFAYCIYMMSEHIAHLKHGSHDEHGKEGEHKKEGDKEVQNPAMGI